MTAPDPRLGEIEARLAADVAAYNDHGFIGDNQCMTDRDYLLTELRKRDRIIAGVIATLDDIAFTRSADRLRAAVTAAKGDGA